MAKRLFASLVSPITGNAEPVAQSTTQGATTRAVGGVGRAVYGSLGVSNVDSVVAHQYERVLWVFRCIDYIATKASSLPITFLQGGRDKGKNPEVDVPDLNRVLNMMANPYELAAQFRYRVSSLGLMSDRGVFIELVRNNAGQIMSVHILPPGRVEPIPDPKNFVAGYRVMNGENTIDFLRPEQVLWLKFKPHPTDPYRQMTPLVAARLTTETDWLTRLYNANFVRNDGRPSMLITVDGLQADDADRLKARFSGGPGRAGETTVLEGAGVNVADLTVNPRDMMYLESLKGSKEEILLAFGVPESQLGNASGRTFDNADAEDAVSWLNTIIPHTDIMSQMWDTLTPGGIDDDIFVVHDTSNIWTLQAAKRAADSDALNKFKMGVWSINEYREATGLNPIDASGARVLWIPGAMVPIGSKADQDASAAQMVPPTPDMGGGEVPGQPPAAVATPEPAVLQQRVSNIGPRAGQPQIVTAQPGLPPAQPNGLRELARGGRRGNTLAVRPTARKALNVFVREVKSGDEDSGDDTEPDRGCEQVHTEPPSHAALIARVQAEVAEVVGKWANDHSDASTARLGGTKARRGTRHWTYVDGTHGTKAIDPVYVANEDKWRELLRGELQPVVTRVVADHARAVAGDDVDTSTLVRQIVDRVVGEAIGAQVREVEQLIRDGEGRGEPVTSMQHRIGGLHDNRWVNRVAAATAKMAVEGARYEAAKSKGTERFTWHTMEDDKVRTLHKRLHGKTRRVGVAFRVAGIPIMRPGDPEAPIHMTANCRCWLEPEDAGI